MASDRAQVHPIGWAALFVVVLTALVVGYLLFHGVSPA